SIVALPTSLILLPLGQPLVTVVFGERWREAGHAVAAMCAASAGAAVVSLASETWKSAGKPEWLPRTHSLGAVLAGGLTAAFLPLGLVGVAFGFSLTAVATGAYALYGVARVIEVPVTRLLDELWPPTTAALAMAGGVYLLELALDADSHRTIAGLALLAGETLAGVAVYVCTLTIVSPATRRALAGACRPARSR